MEAAGVPRLDVERPALVRRSTWGTSQRGPSRQDKSGVAVAYAVAVAEERSARLSWRSPRGNCALGTLVY
jgi:hypothetical protein